MQLNIIYFKNKYYLNNQYNLLFYSIMESDSKDKETKELTEKVDKIEIKEKENT